jgi:hypothetical protein
MPQAERIAGPERPRGRTVINANRALNQWVGDMDGTCHQVAPSSYTLE